MKGSKKRTESELLLLACLEAESGIRGYLETKGDGEGEEESIRYYQSLYNEILEYRRNRWGSVLADRLLDVRPVSLASVTEGGFAVKKEVEK